MSWLYWIMISAALVVDVALWGIVLTRHRLQLFHLREELARGQARLDAMCALAGQIEAQRSAALKMLQEAKLGLQNLRMWQ